MFVSAWNFFTKYLPVFAYTPQSRYLRSSPGLYLRCSENSTEKPWNGLECRPVRNPWMMNFAEIQPCDLSDHFGAKIFLGGCHAVSLFAERPSP